MRRGGGFTWEGYPTRGPKIEVLIDEGSPVVSSACSGQWNGHGDRWLDLGEIAPGLTARQGRLERHHPRGHSHPNRSNHGAVLHELKGDVLPLAHDVDVNPTLYRCP
jgi:hypothetical protein